MKIKPVDVTLENGLFYSKAGPGCDCLILDMITAIQRNGVHFATALAVGRGNSSMIIKKTDGHLVVMHNPVLLSKIGRAKIGCGYKKFRVRFTSVDGREYSVRYSGEELVRVRAGLAELGLL